MYQSLFKHYLLKSFRSPGYYKNMLVNIVMGLTVLYFLGILILMGFLFPKMLSELAPHQSPVATLNSAIIYALLALLFARYMMQPLGKLDLESYQTLPIKRNTLVNYLLVKPLLNPINYLAICFTIPFSITGVYPVYGAGGAFRFVLISILLVGGNLLMASFLKRKLNNLLVGSIVILSIVAVLAALEYFKICSLLSFSEHVFDFLLQSPIAWISMALFPIIAFLLNKSFFAKNYYPENFGRKTNKKESESGNFTFMERFGTIGEIISLEIKLVLRHSRTKKTLYTALLFLLYGLLFYPNEMYNNNPGWLIFVAIFITGIGMIIFGQWVINWDGAHFDFLMTRKIDTSTYIKANYYLLLVLCIISFIATTPYFFFGSKIILFHLTAALYNIGVNIYLYLFAATFNVKRLELSKGTSMNMQGVSYKNFIIMLPLLVFPILLVSLFDLISTVYIALAILSLIGLIGIFFHKAILGMIERQFLKRKYALCTGFRKKQ